RPSRAPAARRAAARPRRRGAARLRDARHQALPVSRARLSGAARRRGGAGGAGRGPRGRPGGGPRRGGGGPGGRGRPRRGGGGGDGGEGGGGGGAAGPRRGDGRGRLGARARARVARRPSRRRGPRMTLLSYAWAFVMLLSVLVFVHELGHFAVARACGVRVLKFSIGFGPPIGFGRSRPAWPPRRTGSAAPWFPL